MSANDTNMIGHNQPPAEEKGWSKSYFYMPIERAKIQIALLKTQKSMILFPSSKTGKSMSAIIDDQIAFLEGKMS